LDAVFFGGFDGENGVTRIDEQAKVVALGGVRAGMRIEFARRVHGFRVVLAPFPLGSRALGSSNQRRCGRELTALEASPKIIRLSDKLKERQYDGPRTGYQSKEEEKVGFKARGAISSTCGCEPGEPHAGADRDQEIAWSDQRRRRDGGRKPATSHAF